MLKNKVCVRREGITKGALYAMILIAKDAGFDISGQNECETDKYTADYIGVDSDYKALQNVYDSTKQSFVEITLEEWLFSSAPDWAVDVRYSADGSLCYTDGGEVRSFICARSVNLGKESSYNLEVIATRSIKEEWKPKVGEKCLCGTHEASLLIAKPDKDGMVVIEIGGEYIIYDSSSLSSLPKHTEQELLAYELYEQIVTGRCHTIETALEDQPITFKNCITVVESGRFK